MPPTRRCRSQRALNCTSGSRNGSSERGGSIVELDEILGYHLEQAALYKVELGQDASGLAEQAGTRLAAAGRRAQWRGDPHAAVELLSRALVLTRPILLDVVTEVDRAWAYDDLGQGQTAVEICEDVADRARAVGSEAGEALARMFAYHMRLHFDQTAEVAELEALAVKARPLLEEQDDHAGLVHVWHALANAAVLAGRAEVAAEASLKAIEHARLAGQADTGSFALGMALVCGPRPADDAIATLEGLFPETRSPGPVSSRARLLAMLGRFDEAWVIAEDMERRSRETAGWAGPGNTTLADIAVLQGDHERAAHYFRIICQGTEEDGQMGFLSSYAPALGRSLCALGYYDEAESLALRGRDVGTEDDYDGQMLWRQVLALVDAHRGQHDQAETLVREAIEIADGTDSLNAQADSRRDLAEVLAAAGRNKEAADALEQALERYERKKNLAMVAQVRPRLEKLRACVR